MRDGLGRRLLWRAAGVVAFAQAVFYLATLVWPEGTEARALVTRLSLWQALQLAPMQAFVGVPLLGALIWGAGGRLVRGLLALSLIAGGALVILALLQADLLHRFLADPTAPRAMLRLLGLARWADAALALAALVALRLAWRAEAERA